MGRAPRHLETEHWVVPTLDVDSAYAFRGRGSAHDWRSSGCGMWRADNGDKPLRRWRTAMGRADDPYDTYAHVVELHRDLGLNTTWFFLLAAFGPHDKGLPSSSPALAELMQELDRTRAVRPMASGLCRSGELPRHGGRARSL